MGHRVSGSEPVSFFFFFKVLTSMCNRLGYDWRKIANIYVKYMLWPGPMPFFILFFFHFVVAIITSTAAFGLNPPEFIQASMSPSCLYSFLHVYVPPCVYSSKCMSLHMYSPISISIQVLISPRCMSLVCMSRLCACFLHVYLLSASISPSCVYVSTVHIFPCLVCYLICIWPLHISVGSSR